MQHLMQLATFRRVAETKNFTAAARELRMTPSAVSRQIRRLEENLGVQLFVRTTRSIRLTEAGAEFYEHCSSGLSQLENAISIVSRFRDEPNGLLRVGTTPCFGKLHIVPAIVDFIAEYPKVEVDISLRHSEASFIENDVDILVTAGPVHGQSIKSEGLAKMFHVICASPDYVKANGAPEKPSDLVKHNCITTTEPKPLYEWPFTEGRRKKYVPISGNFRANSMEALYRAVMAGVGVARLPNYVVGPELRSGELVSLFPTKTNNQSKSTTDPTTISLMKAYYSKGRFPEPKVEAFISFLKRRFGSGYDWECRKGNF